MYYLSKKLIISLFVTLSLLVTAVACGSAQEVSPAVVSTVEQIEALPTNPPEATDIPPTQVLEAPTVESTSTAVPISTVEPTLSAPPLEIISHQSYVDRDRFRIIGEVQNNTDAPMGFVKIIATLYDENNNITGTDFTYTILDVIPPGGKSPFETGTDKWEGTVSYKVQAQGRAATLPTQGLVIPSHQSYLDRDRFRIIGEVQNNTDAPMGFVKIVVTLYDENNNITGTDFTYTALDVISSGGKSPFETGASKWEGTVSYSVQVQGSETNPPSQDIVLLSHDSYIERDRFRIQGEVENTGSVDADFVKIVITLYDANNDVIGMDFTYTTLDVIPPGGTSPFESGTKNPPNFDHYEIQVQG